MTEFQKHAQVAVLIHGEPDQSTLRDMLGLGEFQEAAEGPSGVQPFLRHTRTTSKRMSLV